MPGISRTGWTGWARGLAVRADRAFFLALFLLTLSPSGWAAPLPRVASYTLCADQYLIALADRSQIVGVSWQATSALSLYAEEARSLPETGRSAEDIFYREADVVFLDDRGEPKMEQALTRLGVQVVRIPMGVTFDDVAANTRLVGEAIGQPDRAEALVQQLQARAEVLRETAAGRAHPVGAYYRPGGGGAGAETFVDTAMRLGGFRNLQSELGQVGWTALPMELLVGYPPDVLVLSFFDTAHDSVGNHLGRHAVFRDLRARTPEIDVPGKYWVCTGAVLIEAAEYLAREHERLFDNPEGGS